MALSKLKPNSFDDIIEGNPSLIINGDMAVAQRGTSFTAPSSGVYTLDRWKVQHSHNGAVNVSQSTTAPPNFKNSLKLDVTTADTSLASSQHYLLGHRIEGQNIVHLNYGSSDAKQVTISFWVRSNKTGTYHVELQTSGSQELARQYTIDTADTWEYKTLTWIANTDFTIPEDNTLGLLIYWWFAAGSDFDGSPIPTTWANNTNRVDGQTNFLDSTSNEFYLTGCKMEVGTTATSFQHESYGDNLAKCQRYFTQWTGDASSAIATGVVIGSTTSFISLQLPTAMRAAPTVSQSSTYVYEPQTATVSSIGTIYPTEQGVGVNLTHSSGLTSGAASMWLLNSDAGYVRADAEL